MKIKYKTILLLAISITIVTGSILYVNLSRLNIAYVQSSSLLERYSGMIDAKKEYQKKSNLWRANVDSLVLEIQNDISKLEMSNSKNEKENYKKVIKSKQLQLEQYQKAIGNTAKEEDIRMTSEVIKVVNIYLKEYGKEKGYDLILVANQSGNIAYAKDQLDITEDILNGLNNNYIKSLK